MKRSFIRYTFLLSGLSAALSLTSCYDDVDAPDTTHFMDRVSVSNMPEPTTTIAGIKDSYASYMSGSNKFVQVEEDEIFEGIIVANDGADGLLYQSVYVRDITSTSDQMISIGIKNTSLYPYYPVGQKVRINLKGLYVGNYSYVPKIGTPYYTSAGNLRLGPMLLQDAETHIQLIGDPDTTAIECQPVDLTTSPAEWLKGVSSNSAAYRKVPALVTIKGVFTAADGTSVIAPEELEDAGYAVNRDFKISGTNTTISVRTSTKNELAIQVMPSGEVIMTGIMSYYSGWQFNCRSVAEFKVVE